MKYFFPAVFCFFLALPLMADDFRTATILSYPVGIFDTLTVAGNVRLENAETGARPWNYNASGAYETYPVMQNQYIKIYGGGNYFTTAGSYTADGTLQLGVSGGADEAKTVIKNIYVHPGRYMSAGGAVGITNLAATWLEAFGDINLTGDTTVLTVPSRDGLPAETFVYADKLCFQITDSYTACLPQRDSDNNGVYDFDGQAMVWKGVSNKLADSATGGTGFDYGPWIPATTADADTCPGSDKDSEFFCMEANKAAVNAMPNGLCHDVRSFAAEENYSTEGGVYISRILGRRECNYINTADRPDQCLLGNTGEGKINDYSFDKSTAQMGFLTKVNGIISDNAVLRPNACSAAVTNITLAALRQKYGNYGVTDSLTEYEPLNLRGTLCHDDSLCGNGGCVKQVSCIITGAGTEAAIRDTETADPVLSGWRRTAADTLQPGVLRDTENAAKCERTPWPIGSGLECKNAWDERWFTVITCGPNTGREKGLANQTRYQLRDVSCKGKASAYASGGRYLMLDK